MDCFKLDPHVHTQETSGCGKILARQLVEMYKKAGYGGIVVTDHYSPDFLDGLDGLPWPAKMERYTAGYRAAAARGAEIGLSVLLGLELRFTESNNDYLVYGVDKRFLEENPGLVEMGLESFYGLAGDKGLLVYQAHPFRSVRGPADPRFLDGVEVYNGNPRHKCRNPLAYRFAQERGLMMISGSDCHQPEDVGSGGIVLTEKVTTSQALVEALKKDRIEKLVGQTA